MKTIQSLTLSIIATLALIPSLPARANPTPIPCSVVSNTDLFIPLVTKLKTQPNGAIKVSAKVLTTDLSFVVKPKYRPAKFYTVAGCADFAPIYACMNNKSNAVDLGLASGYR